MRKQELLDRLLILLTDNINAREEGNTHMYPDPEDSFSGAINWTDLTADNTPVDHPTEEGF